MLVERQQARVSCIDLIRESSILLGPLSRIVGHDARIRIIRDAPFHDIVGKGVIAGGSRSERWAKQIRRPIAGFAASAKSSVTNPVICQRYINIFIGMYSSYRLQLTRGQAIVRTAHIVLAPQIGAIIITTFDVAKDSIFESIQSVTRIQLVFFV